MKQLPYDAYYDKNSVSFFFPQRGMPIAQQPGAFIFLTLHLGDSLSQTSLAILQNTREQFIDNHPKPWDRDTTFFFWNTIERCLLKYLDQGYGSCVFKDPAVRECLIKTIDECDVKYCTTYDYVIMPNHLHIILLSSYDGHAEAEGYIKRVSTNRINKLLGRKGPLWMRGHGFSRVVRNHHELIKNADYIKENPAGLPPEIFTHRSIIAEE